MQRLERREVWAGVTTLCSLSSRHPFQQTTKLNGIVNVGDGKLLRDKTAGGTNLQKAFMRQTFHGKAQRNSRNAELLGERNFAHTLPSRELAANQHFAQDQRRSCRLRRSGIGVA